MVDTVTVPIFNGLETFNVRALDSIESNDRTLYLAQIQIIKNAFENSLPNSNAPGPDDTTYDALNAAFNQLMILAGATSVDAAKAGRLDRQMAEFVGMLRAGWEAAQVEDTESLNGQTMFPINTGVGDSLPAWQKTQKSQTVIVWQDIPNLSSLLNEAEAAGLNVSLVSGASNQMTLQTALHLNYVRRGNEILGKELLNLRDAIDANNRLLNTLSDVQDLMNRKQAVDPTTVGWLPDFLEWIVNSKEGGGLQSIRPDSDYPIKLNSNDPTDVSLIKTMHNNENIFEEVGSAAAADMTIDMGGAVFKHVRWNYGFLSKLGMVFGGSSNPPRFRANSTEKALANRSIIEEIGYRLNNKKREWHHGLARYVDNVDGLPLDPSTGQPVVETTPGITDTGGTVTLNIPNIWSYILDGSGSDTQGIPKFLGGYNIYLYGLNGPPEQDIAFVPMQNYLDRWSSQLKDEESTKVFNFNEGEGLVPQLKTTEIVKGITQNLTLGELNTRKLKMKGDLESLQTLFEKFAGEDSSTVSQIAELIAAMGGSDNVLTQNFILDQRVDGGKEFGSSQRVLSDLISSSQSFNDTKRNDVRTVLFQFEEFYKSASSAISVINRILEKMGQNIAR